MSSRTSVAALQRKAAVARVGVVVIPFLAAGLMTFYLSSLGVFRGAGAGLSVEAPETPNQISAENTKLSGTGDDAQRFEVSAAQGLQDKDQETLVHLKTVSGMFQRPAGGLLTVNAMRANYDTDNRTLQLEGNVVFDERGRFTAAMAGARVDTQSQTLTSTAPVSVSVIGGTITADQFIVMGQGERMIFRGGVKASFVGEGSVSGEGSP